MARLTNGTVDDGSGVSIKCTKFTFKNAHRSQYLMNKVFEIQGYIVHHETFGREIRIIQLNSVVSQASELDAWAEAIKLRREVLSKHWNYGDSQSEILTSKPGLSGGSRTSEPLRRRTTFSQEQEMVWRLGSLAPLNQPPELFCSFDRPANVSLDKTNIVETSKGITMSQVRNMKPILSNPRPYHREPALLAPAPSKHQLAKPINYQDKPSPTAVFVNLNTVFYGDSYRELLPPLTHKIPRRYDQPRRTLSTHRICTKQ